MSLPGYVMFGGPKARGTRVHGDIVVSYQYANGEPALVLWPKRPTARSGAFCICLSSAFKYAEDAYLVEQAAKACEVLQLFPTKQTVFQIASAIQDNLDELVKMKPEPTIGKPESVGEGKLFLPNGNSIHFEIPRAQLEDMAE